MNFNDHIKFAVRTENKDFTGIGARASDTRNIRTLHGIIGLVTEVGELQAAWIKARYSIRPEHNEFMDALDKVNAAEEIGDLFWYAALLTDELGQTAVPTVKNKVSFEHRLEIIGQLCNDALDHMKKVLFYGKPMDVDKLRTIVATVVDHGEAMTAQLDTTPEVVRSKNIAKLAARYGEKFSDYLAENRNLEAERAALES